MNIPAKVFISYSHQDEKYKKKLITHLAPLKELGLVKEWHDRMILPGDELHKSIDENLNNSDIILLLISPDYISSYSCYKDEFSKAFKKSEEGSVLIVPIIVRNTSSWTDLPFSKFLALPTDGKAIATFRKADDAFIDITNNLKRLIQNNENNSTIKLPTKELYRKKEDAAESLFLSISSFINEQIASLEASNTFFIFYVDIDDFTKINNKFSYETGNTIVTIMSNLLNEWSLRQEHVVKCFYIYGDQFAIFGTFNLSRKDILAEISKMAKELLQCIEGFKWNSIINNLYVTVSLGIVSYGFSNKMDIAILNNKHVALRLSRNTSIIFNRYFFDLIMQYTLNNCYDSKKNNGKGSYIYKALDKLMQEEKIMFQTVPSMLVRIVNKLEDDNRIWYFRMS